MRLLLQSSDSSISQTAADVFCFALVKSRNGHRHRSTTILTVLGYFFAK